MKYLRTRSGAVYNCLSGNGENGEYTYMKIVNYFDYSIHQVQWKEGEEEPLDRVEIPKDPHTKISLKRYFFKGKLHNENGPAYVNNLWDKFNDVVFIREHFYYMNGMRHRAVNEGPARITYDEKSRPLKQTWIVKGKEIEIPDKPYHINYFYNDEDNTVRKSGYFYNNSYGYLLDDNNNKVATSFLDYYRNK